MHKNINIVVLLHSEIYVFLRTSSISNHCVKEEVVDRGKELTTLRVQASQKRGT